MLKYGNQGFYICGGMMADCTVKHEVVTYVNKYFHTLLDLEKELQSGILIGALCQTLTNCLKNENI